MHGCNNKDNYQIGLA